MLNKIKIINNYNHYNNKILSNFKIKNNKD